MTGYFIYCNKTFKDWELFENKMKYIVNGKNPETFKLLPGVINLKRLNEMLLKFHYWYDVGVELDEKYLDVLDEAETIIFESKEDAITKQLKKYLKKNHIPYQIYKS